MLGVTTWWSSISASVFKYHHVRGIGRSVDVLDCRGSLLLGSVSADFMSEPVEGPEIEEDEANGKKGRP